MKIRIILLVVSLGVFKSLQAQDRELKHQVFLSVGLLDISYLENVLTSSNGVSGSPGLSMLEYRFIQDRMGLGVSVFSRSLDQVMLSERRAHRFFGILPHFDFYWANGAHHQVSSQLAFGYRFGETTTTTTDNAYFQSLYLRRAFQIIPLSVTIGKGRWLGRFEVGIGHKGFGTLGIGLQL